MATMIKFLCLLIFLSLATQGMAQCTLKDMTVAQTKLNKNVNNRPMWNVTISNNCYCSQADVRIACKGFRTAKRLDPSSVKVSPGGVGLVNDGKPIYPYTSVGFTYAWNIPMQFKILSSQIACS